MLFEKLVEEAYSSTLQPLQSFLREPPINSNGSPAQKLDVLNFSLDAFLCATRLYECARDCGDADSRVWAGVEAAVRLHVIQYTVDHILFSTDLRRLLFDQPMRWQSVSFGASGGGTAWEVAIEFVDLMARCSEIEILLRGQRIEGGIREPSSAGQLLTKDWAEEWLRRVNDAIVGAEREGDVHTRSTWPMSHFRREQGVLNAQLMQECRDAGAAQKGMNGHPNSVRNCHIGTTPQKLEQAIAFIRRNPGTNLSKNVAEHIGVEVRSFNSHYSKALKIEGCRIDQKKGWHPPSGLK